LPETYAYYVDGQKGFGSWPQNAQKMVYDAVLMADPDVDYSLYDETGPSGVPDGQMDGLFVVHAGTGSTRNSISEFPGPRAYPLICKKEKCFYYSKLQINPNMHLSLCQIQVINTDISEYRFVQIIQSPLKRDKCLFPQLIQ